MPLTLEIVPAMKGNKAEKEEDWIGQCLNTQAGSTYRSQHWPRQNCVYCSIADAIMYNKETYINAMLTIRTSDGRRSFARAKQDGKTGPYTRPMTAVATEFARLELTKQMISCIDKPMPKQ